MLSFVGMQLPEYIRRIWTFRVRTLRLQEIAVVGKVTIAFKLRIKSNHGEKVKQSDGFSQKQCTKKM